MMRGLRPLVGFAALACAAAAGATEMVEVPTPPADPPRPPDCCAVADEARPRERGDVLLQVSVGPTYRRAFREDFAAAAFELEIGGQTPSFGVGGRMRGDFGATKVGLPYQFATFGPNFWFRASPRVRVAVGLTFGTFSYQRATIPSDTVWAPTIGGDVSATVDLVRTRRGGALLLLGRAGYDWIDNFGGPDRLSTGSSLALTAALGYRY